MTKYLSLSKFHIPNKMVFPLWQRKFAELISTIFSLHSMCQLKVALLLLQHNLDSSSKHGIESIVHGLQILQDYLSICIFNA